MYIISYNKTFIRTIEGASTDLIEDIEDLIVNSIVRGATFYTTKPNNGVKVKKKSEANLVL